MTEDSKDSREPEHNLAEEVIAEEKILIQEEKKITGSVKKLEQIINKLRRVELQEFTNYLHSPWRIFWANFLAGTSRGLGFLFGVAIVLTIIGFLMTKILTQIPVVGDFFQAINLWIQETLQRTI